MDKGDKSINELMLYLCDWRSASEIKEEFRLSQTEFFNLTRRLVRAGFIQRCSGRSLEWVSDNRTSYYKVKNK